MPDARQLGLAERQAADGVGKSPPKGAVGKSPPKAAAGAKSPLQELVGKAKPNADATAGADGKAAPAADGDAAPPAARKGVFVLEQRHGVCRFRIWGWVNRM